MHKKLVLVVFSVMVILAIAVSPVGAITGNWVEDNEHPFVIYSRECACTDRQTSRVAGL